MVRFTISGERNGRHVSVTWTDGDLSGDADTVTWLRQMARLLDGTIQGSPGLPKTTTDHLSSPYTARSLMRSVFGGKVTQRGSLPPLPDVPRGAIR